MASLGDHVLVNNHRKRKRRRRQDKPPVNARLVLDDHIKGDVGIVSEDLFKDLFPGSVQEDVENSSSLELHHIAIAPKSPSSNVDDISWTVVPIRPSSALANFTIQFSPLSLALQGFAEELQRTAPSKLLSHSRSGIEVCVLDVLPLTLDTIFVTIEGDLARRLENGEGTFHGEHPSSNGQRKKHRGSGQPEDLLTSGVREALGALKVVHVGDFFALPLAPHPITHVPPPPAKVTLCEPVAQGILSPSTRIIITQTHHHTKIVRNAPLNRMISEVVEDEDTSNEQFFSAAEDRYKTDAPIDEDENETETEEEASDGEDDNLSDDSMEDMISLQAPTLSATSSSALSTIPGTPGMIGLGRGVSGMKSPGSVFSAFTGTTARAGGQRGRLFKAQGLFQPIPEELLRPAPAGDDDEEARIYIDVHSLAKIGCFSGDWVRVATAAEPPSGIGLWGLGSLAAANEEDFTWRPLKIFSLPEGYSPRQITKIPGRKQGERRLSFFESQVSKPTSPTAYVSPILLANMDSPPYMRISTLKRTQSIGSVAQPKITSSSRPPSAREMTLLRIASPLSTERMLMNTFFIELKKHFAHRTRLVKTGDLVAIPIDENLGRTLYQASSNSDNHNEDLENAEAGEGQVTKSTNAVWFRVGNITPAKLEDPESLDEEDTWGGVVLVDGFTTQMSTKGVEQSRFPATVNNPWQYYLNLRHIHNRGGESMATLLPEARPQNITPLRRRLKELIAAATSPRAIHLQLEPLGILLVSTQRNIGKATIAARACTDIGLHVFGLDAYDLLSEGGSGGSDVKTEASLKARAERAFGCGAENCALLIQHIEALTADRMISALKDVLSESRVLIATTTEVNKIPDGVRGLFRHELEMNAPDEWEREGILKSIIEDHGASLAVDVNLSGVAVKTAALVAGDLVDVVDRALVAKRARLENLASSSATELTPISIRDVQVSGGLLGQALNKADFDFAVDAARKNFADAIGAPKIPSVSWDDVGGLNNVKDAVMETIQLPLERPELFASGMKKRSGILFYGPPGTGKTLLAKAIATEFSLNFFSVKGPELLNMYIGESEANVRRVFQRARDARPCVVFFDELDSVAPKRGNQGDSGGVMDRIVSQLLAELDGMSDGDDGGGGVFVIGATNRPDLLDAALLRPGRFDKMLYLGVSDTHEKQVTIMEALTRKFTMSPSLSLKRVASHLPFTYTGADFYALCSDAMLKAVTRQASSVDAQVAVLNKNRQRSNSKYDLDSDTARQNRLPKITPAYFFDHFAAKEDLAVVVTEEDFMGAWKELIPSVSAKELEHYKRVREQFEAAPNAEKRAADKTVESGDGPGNGMVKRGDVSEWQTTLRPKSNGKIPSRVRGKDKGKDKGKGKAKADFDDVDEEEENGYEANGYGFEGHESRISKMNGVAIVNGFQDGGADDDEGVY